MPSGGKPVGALSVQPRIGSEVQDGVEGVSAWSAPDFPGHGEDQAAVPGDLVSLSSGGGHGQLALCGGVLNGGLAH
eukprot:10690549-Lingulodinium_polyedra.AAC.1